MASTGACAAEAKTGGDRAVEQIRGCVGDWACRVQRAATSAAWVAHKRRVVKALGSGARSSGSAPGGRLREVVDAACRASAGLGPWHGDTRGLHSPHAHHNRCLGRRQGRRAPGPRKAVIGAQAPDDLLRGRPRRPLLVGGGFDLYRGQRHRRRGLSGARGPRVPVAALSAVNRVLTVESAWPARAGARPVSRPAATVGRRRNCQRRLISAVGSLGPRRSDSSSARAVFACARRLLDRP
jgi:hypothetical protein